MTQYTKPKPQGTEPITTPRLDLRKFKDYDSAAIVEWSNDEETIKYFVTNPVANEEEASTVIGCWRSNYSKEEFLKWCISEAETRKAIGEISASLDMATSTAEIEYAIAPSARGKGYAAEALENVIKYLHEAAGVHRVIAQIHTENISSTKTAENAGMNLEGILEDALADRDGNFYDVALFAHVQKD